MSSLEWDLETDDPKIEHNSEVVITDGAMLISAGIWVIIFFLLGVGILAMIWMLNNCWATSLC